MFGVNGPINNWGTVCLDIEVGELSKKQWFCVVERIECNVDGILGIDFLHKVVA